MLEEVKDPYLLRTKRRSLGRAYDCKEWGWAQYPAIVLGAGTGSIELFRSDRARFEFRTPRAAYSAICRGTGGPCSTQTGIRGNLIGGEGGRLCPKCRGLCASALGGDRNYVAAPSRVDD